MKRFRWVLALTGIALIAAAAFVLVAPRSSGGLFGKATLRGPARNWGMHYFWLDDRRILTFRAKGPHAEAVEIDVSTQSERPLIHLSSTFRGFQATGERHLSPDGNWLLWTGQADATREPHVIASRIDGPQRRAWQMGQKVAWNQQGTAWLQFRQVRGRPVIRVQPLASKVRREIVIPVVRNQPRPLAHNTAVLQGEFLGRAASGRYLLANTHAALMTGGRSFLYQLNPDRPVDSICTGVVLPSPFVVRVVLSPNGEKLAWLAVTYEQPIGFVQFLARYYPQWRRPPKQTVGIWITDSAGSNLSHLGTFDPELGITDPYRFAEGTRWMPNSRSISFVFRDKLYTLPVGG